MERNSSLRGVRWQWGPGTGPKTAPLCSPSPRRDICTTSCISSEAKGEQQGGKIASSCSFPTSHCPAVGHCIHGTWCTGQQRKTLHFHALLNPAAPATTCANATASPAPSAAARRHTCRFGRCQGRRRQEVQQPLPAHEAETGGETHGQRLHHAVVFQPDMAPPPCLHKRGRLRTAGGGKDFINLLSRAQPAQPRCAPHCGCVVR